MCPIEQKTALQILTDVTWPAGPRPMGRRAISCIGLLALLPLGLLSAGERPRVRGEQARRLEGHARLIYCLAFRADGKTLITGGTDGRRWELAFWDVETKRRQRTERAPRDSAPGLVSHLSAAAGGDQLAAAVRLNKPGGWEWELTVWDVKRMAPSHRRTLDAKGVGGVALLPDPADKYRVLVSKDGSWIDIWGPELDETRARIVADYSLDRALRGLAVSPDGTRIAMPNDFGVKLRDLYEGRKGKEFWRFFRDGHPHGVSCAAFSPDGTVLATAGGFPSEVQLAEYFQEEERDYSILLRKLPTGRILTRMDALEHKVVKLLFTPDGKRVLSLSEDRTLSVWDAETGKALRSIAAEDPAAPPEVRGIRDVAVSPTGSTVAGIANDRVYLWDLRTGKTIAVLQ